MVSVRSRKAGCTAAMVACLSPSSTRCSYMSSDMIHTCGWRSITSPSAAISAAEQAAPVGLLGKFRISHLVRGVMAASRSSGRSLKPLFCGQFTATGTPPASGAISG